MPAPRYESPRSAPETILRLPVVVTRTGRCRSAIYADIAAGTFPKPIQLGPRAVGWRQSDIDAWLNSRQVGTLAPPAVNRRKAA
jgi:prophage regulatory protein